MEKKFTVFIVWLGLISFVSCAQKKNDKVVPIAFYNVENLFDTQNDPLTDDDEFTPEGKCHYTDRVYEQKLHNIAIVLAQLGTDKQPYGPAVIGLAEVENSKVLIDLLLQPELKDRGYKFIWFKGPDLRGITVALLYRPQQFKLLHARPLEVLLEGGEPTRDILFATGVIATDTVHILVNHWPSRRGEDETENKRITVAQANRVIVDSLLNRNHNANIILIGDLNDNPDNISIAKVLGATDDKVAPLYNPWLSIYRSGAGTLIHKHEWDLFDNIIISKGLLRQNRLHFKEAEVFNRQFLITQGGKFAGYPHRSFAGTRWINGYSDHLPVLLYLEKR